MADLTLALTGVSAAVAVGTTVPDVDGGTTFKALTGTAGVGALGSVAAGRSIALTGVSGVGGVGAAITTHITGFQGVAMPWPAFSMALVGTVGAIGDAEWTMPAASIAFAGRTSLTGRLTMPLPELQLVMTGLVGASGALALDFPAMQLELAGPHTLDLDFPAVQLELAGHTGRVGTLGLNLPPPSFAFEGRTDALGGLVLSMPKLRMALAGDTGRVGRMDLTLRKMALAMEGVTGTLGSVVIELPVFQLEMGGHIATSGTLELVLPALQLTATGHAAAVATGQPQAANASTLVMQTERGALTEYTNYPFNSFAAFNGTFLGASEDGVFALTGDTDNGAAIAAAARGMTTDFGSSHLKRIERAYVGYRSTGQMVLRVVTEERWTRDYAIAPATHAGLHGAHARFGRGLEARYWQFEVRNHEGCDFSMDMIELKPIKLKRRVGGGNA